MSRLGASLLALLVTAASVPFVLATHPQSVAANGAGYSIEFDHDGDNEWWVEVQARARDGDSIFIMFAQVEGTSTWHYLKFAANSWERTQDGWSKFAPDKAFQVPAGKRVMFKAGMSDGPTGTTADILSCWFTHPAGVEQCSSSSSTGTLTPGAFDAQFTGVRGNEWWVQAQVAANRPLAKVDVSLDGGTWKPLNKQSWGWAASYHIVQGTIVQLRATSTAGETTLSSCRQWIPPSGQDAMVVPCGGGGGTRFDATFTGVKGNEWWVQANVAGNEPIAGVAFRVNCAPQWIPLAKQSWGGWAPTHQVIIPSGSKVDFMATSADGDVDASGGYRWTAATATTPCALGAWPHEGSRAAYDLTNDVCGGGECFHAEAAHVLTYKAHSWEGWCAGQVTHTRMDGTQTTEPFTTRLDMGPLFTTVPTTVGATQGIRTLSVSAAVKSCGVEGNDRMYTVDHRETRASGLRDSSGNPVLLDAWVAERDAPEENFLVAAFDTKLGMVFEEQSYPRRSGQGSGSLFLVETDAPIR